MYTKNKNNIISKVIIKLNNKDKGYLNIYEKYKKKKDKSIFLKIKSLFIR